MSPKTVIEKSQSPSPDVTVFKISGTLGFHEKDNLEKLFRECARRGLTRVVLDVSGLTSLGGGCAQIIRDEAAKQEIAIGVVGARATVLKFLKKDNATNLTFDDTVEDAVPNVLDKALPGASGTVHSNEPASIEPASDEELLSEETLSEVLDDAPSASEVDADPPVEDEMPIEDVSDPPVDTEVVAEPDAGPDAVVEDVLAADADSADARELQKRIVQYNTLFSINADFSRIHDRRGLLEALLLTTIAQVGVESAVFLEANRKYFVPVAVKGIEANELRGFALPEDQLRLDRWSESFDVLHVDRAPFTDEVKAPLLALGCSFVAPFVAHGEFRGIILLGRPLKREMDQATIEFLKMLVNQAAIAYENMSRLEEENQRTLGLVQTLISLIEENTLARGNTNLISNYVYALAQAMHYPEEHVRDLMYGTVLRDIGMIKVSDLIVRSPRELMPEEWDIIKRHPVDGAEMLRRMKFSTHAVDIVLAHHERFNGDGYPNGTQGQDIPLGARIVSVVESYAAMLQDRPTRPALTREEALNTLKENWGMRYDPDVVVKFAEIVEDELGGGASISDKQFELFSV